MEMTRKEHWENIYSNKKLEEVSWYQPKPEVSLAFISAYSSSKTDAIIDIGGGDSFLIDYLLKQGYHDITVLDISEKALQRAQHRLESLRTKVQWLTSDITEFNPLQPYQIWHDRAVFHFLTEENEVKKYALIAAKALAQNSLMIIGTFSDKGPLKCSGIAIQQYTVATMCQVFQDNFELIDSKEIIHQTPMQTEQQFIFCVFRKK
ncbi:MAG: class I SAM-dependent methyltransferase [Flavobacterium sp.]|nr:class I SAM-dependent methyltransferase [Flavobacterium sp.]MDD2985285.1 class I SAM-dependent methyltransferase [Flavobacterium sp.]